MRNYYNEYFFTEHRTNRVQKEFEIPRRILSNPTTDAILIYNLFSEEYYLG
jgi:hypothetical protein